MQCCRLDELDIVSRVFEVTDDVAAAQIRVHVAWVVGSGSRLISRSAGLVKEPILARRPVLGSRVPAHIKLYT